MSLADDYRPCRHCGALTDSGCCSPECAEALEAEDLQFRHRICLLGVGSVNRLVPNGGDLGTTAMLIDDGNDEQE